MVLVVCLKLLPYQTLARMIDCSSNRHTATGTVAGNIKAGDMCDRWSREQIVGSCDREQ